MEVIERKQVMIKRDQKRAFWYYSPRALIALATLAILIAAGRTTTWPQDGMSIRISDGRVISVAPGEPAARAGVKVGDVVLKIDGNDPAGSRLYQGKHAGDSVRLTLRRNAERFDVTLTLAAPAPEHRVGRLIPMLVAGGFWAAGTGLLVLRPRDDTCRAFFRLAQVAVVALTAGQLSTFNVTWGVHLFVWALAALPPFLFDAYGHLVNPDQPWLRAITPWLSIASLLLTLPDLWLLLRFGARANATPLWPRWRGALLLYLTAGLLGLMGSLIYTYATTRNAATRRRLRGVVFAVTLGCLPMVALSLLPEALWGLSAGLPFQSTFPFLLLIPAAHVYIVTRYDLRPLDRIINRSLVVFLLGLIWGGIYLTGAGIGMRLFRDEPLLYVVVGVLTTIVMALVFSPLMVRVQRAVDHLFYGGWYDYRQVIAHVSQSLNQVTSRDALGERLVLPVVNGLHLRGGALYLRSPDATASRLVAAQGIDAPPSCPDLHPNDQKRTATVMTADTTWQQRGAAWILALQRLESEPIGWLLLGEKHEDDFFEDADVDILQTLREQATLAAENVLLFESLRETAHALEMAQRRLLTAREEERRVLSWDLHDGPLQDLVALSYDLYTCRTAARRTMPGLERQLEAARQTSLRIKDRLRTICREMRSDLLDVLGLESAIRRYVHDFMQDHDVVIYLDVPRRRTPLPDLLGITLFRILQEALANAAAHAGAQEVWVRLSLDDAAYELRVWDRGKGFVVPKRLETLALRGHFGLITIRERAASVGAHFTVQAHPGKGTEIRVWGQWSQQKRGDKSL